MLGATTFFVTSAIALPLPSGFIALNSTDGFNLLHDPRTLSAPFQQAIIHFVSQQDGGSCFRASASIILNTLSMHGVEAPLDMGKWIDVPYWNQDNVVNSTCARSNCTDVYCRGAPLPAASKALACPDGVSVRPIHAGQHGLNSSQQLSAILFHTLGAPGGRQHIIANFFGPPMGLNHHGHYSPVVAYNDERDMALVLDVSRYKYPPWWVPTQVLFKGLDTVDPSTMQRRGMLVVQAAMVAAV